MSQPSQIPASERIVAFAREFLHVKEIGANGGFNDAGFELLIKTYGWRQGYAWCMFFCKMVWALAYRDTQQYEAVSRVLNGSVLDSYRRAKLEGWRITDKPVEGGILIFDAGNGKGHACICYKIRNEFSVGTIDGNTNKAGSREGDAVMEKHRILNANKGKLRYLGCIHPLKETYDGNDTSTIA